MAVFPGKEPGVGDDDDSADARFLHFLGPGVGRALAVDEARAGEEVGRAAVGQAQTLGQQGGRHLADIEGPRPRFLVDARVAGDEDTEGGRSGLFLPRVGHSSLREMRAQMYSMVDGGLGVSS
jgi:hypothetical protein